MPLFSHRSIRTAALASLCERLAMTHAAGIELQKAWRREAAGASGRAGQVYNQVADDLERGESLADALGRTDQFFPPLFVELLAIGEASGHLPEMLRHLREQYQMQLDARRTFQMAMIWPSIQLVLAIGIVGFLIAVLGIIGNSAGGEPFDPLGVGLIGPSGAAIYFAIIVGLFVVGWLVVQAAKAGGPFGRFVVTVARRLPLAGGAIRSIALARYCWTLGLGLTSAMDVARAVTLSIRATRDPKLLSGEADIIEKLERRGSICDAFAGRGLPRDLLHEMDVAEQAGQLPETLLAQAKLYNAEAKSRLNRLAVAASFLCWAMVAGLIILVIFRLFFTFILGPYREFGLI